MLILGRRRNESVIIGEGKNKIRVTVVDIRGDKIRLGFEASKEVQIFREEIAKENES